MATTVTPAATASFQLGPFDTLTLNSSGARGSIALTSSAPKLRADQSLLPQSGTFGPWGAPMSVVMTITQGACDYTVNVQSLTAAQSQSILAREGNKARSRVLKKCLPGRMVVYGNQQGGGGSDSAVGTNWTTVMQMELEAPFSAIRIWVPNADTAAVATQTKVAVAVQQAAGAFGAAANIDYSAGDGLVNATFDNGVASASTAGGNAIAAGVAANRPTWKATDWIGIKSLARTDGGARPLLQVRVEQVWVSANWKLTCPYITAAGWQDGVTAGGRLFRRFAQNVNGVSTPANFTSLTAENSKWCPVIVEYQLANGMGVQHMIVGDSISEGAGASDSWYGCHQRAVYELSTPSAPREIFNGALHSQIPSAYAAYLGDMISTVLPDVLHYQPYSVNSISTDITAGILQTYRQQLGRAIGLAASYRPAVLTVAGTPCNPAFKTYTNDARRIAYNADISAQSSVSGQWYYADIASPLSGAVDANGQTNMASGVSSDNVHPNDTGHDLAKIPLKVQIAAIS